MFPIFSEFRVSSAAQGVLNPCARQAGPSCTVYVRLRVPLEAGFSERRALLFPGACVHCPSYACLPVCTCELWFQGF